MKRLQYSKQKWSRTSVNEFKKATFLLTLTSPDSFASQRGCKEANNFKNLIDFVISVEDYHKLTQIQFLIQPPLGSQTFRVVKTVAGHRIICSMSVCKLFYPLTISNCFCPPCKSTCTRKVVLLTLFLPHKGKLVSMAFIRRKTHISHRLNLFFGQFSEFKLDHAKSEQNCFVWLWHEERMLLHARI